MTFTVWNTENKRNRLQEAQKDHSEIVQGSSDTNRYKRNSYDKEGREIKLSLLSPYLFNLFIEEAIGEIMEETNGVRINGKQIHCVRFSDDIALVAESEDDMNFMQLCPVFCTHFR